MSVVQWPNAFPSPDSGFAATVGESVQVLKMDSGEYRNTRDRQGRAERYNVTLELFTFRAAMFVSWFKHKLGGGANAFILPTPNGNDGLTDTTVRFYEPKFSVSLKQLPFLWSVSFSVETNSKLDFLGSVDPLNVLVEETLPPLF